MKPHHPNFDASKSVLVCILSSRPKPQRSERTVMNQNKENSHVRFSLKKPTNFCTVLYFPYKIKEHFKPSFRNRVKLKSPVRELALVRVSKQRQILSSTFPTLHSGLFY